MALVNNVVSVKGEKIVDFAKEISGNMSDNGEESTKDSTTKVEALKAEKTKIKSDDKKTAKRVSGSGCWR